MTLYQNITMHTTNLRKVGGSVMLAIPPALLDILRLQPGARVGIAVESGRLVVEPRQRPRYTLDELLSQCDTRTRRTRTRRGRSGDKEEEWPDNRPGGGELI
jgi:antitoxin ChpS